MTLKQQIKLLKAAVRVLAALDTITLTDAVSLSSNFPSDHEIKKMNGERDAALEDLRDAIDEVLFKAHPRVALSTDNS